MEVIREIVTSIIIVLVLAALLEMILPNSAMQRFVKVIMGLFIIVTLLNPLVSLINEDLGSELTSLTAMDRNEELQSILTKGKELSDQSREKVLVEYEKRLGQQIVSVANFTEDSKVIEAKVRVNRDSDQKTIGNIEEIVLVMSENNKTISENQGVVEPVSPIKVEIQGQGEDSQARDPTTEVTANNEANLNEAVDAIASFYGISREQIKVVQSQE